MFRAQEPLSLGTDTSVHQSFLCSKADRARGIHTLGAPGLGKSRILRHILQHIIVTGATGRKSEREGLCFIDPPGSTARDLLRFCVENRITRRRKLLLFDPTPSWIPGYNPFNFDAFAEDERGDAVRATVKAIATAWGEDLTKTPRLARCLPLVLHTIAEKHLTLYDALDLCQQSPTQRVLSRDIRDQKLREDWDAMNALQPHVYAEHFDSTRSRLNTFLENPLVRLMLAQEKSIDLYRAMEEHAIVIVNLGRLLDEDARLLGSLMVNSVFIHSKRREADRSSPFTLAIDEAHRLLNEDGSAGGGLGEECRAVRAKPRRSARKLGGRNLAEPFSLQFFFDFSRRSEADEVIMGSPQKMI